MARLGTEANRLTVVILSSARLEHLAAPVAGLFCNPRTTTHLLNRINESVLEGSIGRQPPILTRPVTLDERLRDVRTIGEELKNSLVKNIDQFDAVSYLSVGSNGAERCLVN